MNINFDYSFAAPHALALCRPSASEKYLLNIEPSKIQLLYSFDSLKDSPLLSWSTPEIDLETELTIREDGQEYLLQEWKRHESGAPWLIARGQSKVICRLDAVATRIGVVVKLNFENTDAEHHDITVKCRSLRGWVISNQGWIDYKHNNLLLTLNKTRADRIIGYFLGADDYPMFRNGIAQVSVPMSDAVAKDQGNSMKYTTALFSMKPGETKSGFLVLPFEKYFEDFDELCQVDYDKEMKDALDEWCELLDRGTKISICDKEVISCFRACLADLFVMREPHAGGYVIGNGTRHYRSPASGEPLTSTLQLDRMGYLEEASGDLQIYYAGQNEDGCWAYSKGWEHDMWSIHYMKCNSALQHYYITRDRDFLEDVYCRMKRAALFARASRQSTQNDPVKSHRGMMQRGMGDCGMMDNGDYYGFFYPQDIMAAAADKLTLKAAQILGYEEDVKWLTEYCEETARDLITSLRENSIKEEGYEWIPSVPGSLATSLYGCLYAYHPAGLLDAEDPLIRGTIQHVSTKSISEGGLPVGTGWMPEGIWVAMALDNFSSVYLRMGNRDLASSFLYPVLNHASPLVTWCEERGKEKGSAEKSGDLQHLWTPLSVVAYMLDAMLYEDDEAIHICAGIPRHWLAEGKSISVSDLCTRCGKTSFTVENRENKLYYDIQFEYEPDRPVYLYFRTPDRDEPVMLESFKGTIK